MIIKIFGPGCPKCQTLEENARKAVQELNLNGVEIEKISEIEKIVEAGIMAAPAIMIDGTLKAVGRVPDVREIKSWLK